MSPSLRPYLAALTLLLCGHLQAADEPAPTKEGEAPAAAVERAPLSERSVDDATALAKRVPEKEQQKLQAGDEEFLALWKLANVGDAIGVIILIPGDGETADWPQAMAPLREKLPDAGWHTLSLSLPDPQGDEPPLRPIEEAAPPGGEEKNADAPAQTSEPAPATTPENAAVPADNTPPPSGISEEQRATHATRVSARIEAAIAFTQEKKAKAIVLLGHGSGGYWAARYLADNKPKQVSNLILVAAEKPVGFSPALEDLVPELKLATGDFYYNDQPLDRDAAKLRKEASKRQKHPAYIQVAMAGMPGDRATEQEQLYRRVKGWLSQHLQSGAARPDAPAPAEAPEPSPPPEPTSPGI
ncbi:pimeloyl-ACP methyl ester carboxylesterase [Pseudomonas sp. TE3786]